jgi:TFIIH basal transcription factor complex TTD-A subunit
MKIDEANHNYVIEELDDQTLVIKENMLNSLKYRLNEVCFMLLQEYKTVV